MKSRYIFAFALFTPFHTTIADQQVVDSLLNKYQNQGALVANINNGRQLWEKNYLSASEPKNRSCSSCHTKNLLNTGKHIRTAKIINPLAPSINPLSLSKKKKIKKWFKRNCKWTMGRECSAQEKSDILAYINQH